MSYFQLSIFFNLIFHFNPYPKHLQIAVLGPIWIKKSQKRGMEHLKWNKKVKNGTKKTAEMEQRK